MVIYGTSHKHETKFFLCISSWQKYREEYKGTLELNHMFEQYGQAREDFMKMYTYFVLCQFVWRKTLSSVGHKPVALTILFAWSESW
jgi:hypothetical protein